MVSFLDVVETRKIHPTISKSNMCSPVFNVLINFDVPLCSASIVLYSDTVLKFFSMLTHELCRNSLEKKKRKLVPRHAVVEINTSRWLQYKFHPPCKQMKISSCFCRRSFENFQALSLCIPENRDLCLSAFLLAAKEHSTAALIEKNSEITVQMKLQQVAATRSKVRREKLDFFLHCTNLQTQLTLREVKDSVLEGMECKPAVQVGFWFYFGYCSN